MSDVSGIIFGKADPGAFSKADFKKELVYMSLGASGSRVTSGQHQVSCAFA